MSAGTHYRIVEGNLTTYTRNPEVAESRSREGARVTAVSVSR